MTHCTQGAHQTERRRLSPLVGSLVIATVVMATLQPVGLAAAADCLINEDTLAVQSTPSWGTIIPPIQAHPPTLIRDCVCELTPYVNNSRFALGKTDNPGIAALTACLSWDSGKMALLAHTTLGPVRQVNSRIQTLRVSTLSYKSKKHAFMTRPTLPEIKRSMTYKPAATITGPIQEFRNAAPADERSMGEAIPSVPPMDKPSALFGDHPCGPLNQFEGLQRLPNSESHRMNMTTALALHGRDCVSDCP